MNIIYEDNHLLVVDKPINIPMQLDSSNDIDLLSLCKKYLKEKYNKPGNVYLGLVHRLDRPVSGVCVFAKTSKAAARLSKQISDHTFKKEYLAVVEDNNLKQSGHYEDYLLKDSKTNTVKIDKNGKLAILDYELIKRKNNLALVKIQLQTGRSHQIRVQFSSRNHSLYGDQRYNKNAKVGQQIALHAYKITFKHPITNEIVEFTSNVNRVPFSYFLQD
jgi:23S rRNA pseudouridine1911/1915/1917 synthase